jgi:hypothetical protein
MHDSNKASQVVLLIVFRGLMDDLIDPAFWNRLQKIKGLLRRAHALGVRKTRRQNDGCREKSKGG